MTELDEWSYQRYAFEERNITGPTSVLSTKNTSNVTMHFLFFGGRGHISIAKSRRPDHWQHIDETAWLKPRRCIMSNSSNYFDRDGVESGPPPIRLQNGNYLMLYNGYTIKDIDRFDFSWCNLSRYEGLIPRRDKQYQIGWVVLDGNDPSKIVERSEEPVISPMYDFENCIGPWTCTINSSVYAKAIIALNSSSNGSHDTDTFRVYFSASDTSIGTAIINITYTSTATTTAAWYRTALIVSVGCALFVMMMLFILRCRKQKSNTLDLAADPRFLSIASAHHEISGTNHRGTSYIVGSFESAPSRRSKRNSRSHRDRDKYRTLGHLHNSECYLKDSPCYQRITSSGSSSTSSSICNCSCSTTDSESDRNTSSASSYCPHCQCHGKDHESGQEQSESVRLSQISFPIHDTLDDDSPKSNKWSLGNQSLGEHLIRKE